MKSLFRILSVVVGLVMFANGARFLVDPVWAARASPLQWLGPKRFFAPPLPLEELPEIDAVLISHDHYDHLDRKPVKRLGREGHRFVVPRGVGALLERWGVPAERVRELDWWESVEVGGVEVTGIAGNTKRTPLDECGHVYKDLDAVIGVLEQEGIARLANRLYPVANIKGTD